MRKSRHSSSRRWLGYGATGRTAVAADLLLHAGGRPPDPAGAVVPAAVLSPLVPHIQECPPRRGFLPAIVLRVQLCWPQHRAQSGALRCRGVMLLYQTVGARRSRVRDGRRAGPIGVPAVLSEQAAEQPDYQLSVTQINPIDMINRMYVIILLSVLPLTS